MNVSKENIMELYKRIPRRHTRENFQEINNLLDEYEDLLKNMEADDRYAKQVARFFEELDPIRTIVKKSNDNKASKRSKDVLFDEAADAIKDTLQELMHLLV